MKPNLVALVICGLAYILQPVQAKIVEGDTGFRFTKDSHPPEGDKKATRFESFNRSSN